MKLTVLASLVAGLVNQHPHHLQVRGPEQWAHAAVSVRSSFIDKMCSDKPAATRQARIWTQGFCTGVLFPTQDKQIWGWWQGGLDSRVQEAHSICLDRHSEAHCTYVFGPMSGGE